MKNFRKHRQSGFTLIEIIVTLVLVSVLATFFFSYFGDAITHSADPVIRLSSSLNNQQVMENIYADYRRQYKENITGLKTNIGAESAVMNNSYGSYTVLENKYIQYNELSCVSPCPEIIGGTNLLKVKIKDNISGEMLSALFPLLTLT